MRCQFSLTFFILFRSLAPCSISLRQFDGSVKKNTLKKVPCKKYFETHFTNLHSFFNTIERANLRLELFLFHSHIKIMKNINAAGEIREGRKILSRKFSEICQHVTQMFVAEIFYVCFSLLVSLPWFQKHDVLYTVAAA